MNTKSLPAVIALIAGFVTCIMSFIQHVDTVVFAKRFIIVCIIFYIIGMIAGIIINMNFKSGDDGKEAESEDEDASLEKDGSDEEENEEVSKDIKE